MNLFRRVAGLEIVLRDGNMLAFLLPQSSLIELSIDTNQGKRTITIRTIKITTIGYTTIWIILIATNFNVAIIWH